MINKIVFISNILTQHQIPFSQVLKNRCGEYYFIQLEDKGDVYEKKGVEISLNNYPYVLIFDREKERCKKLILEADVVIVGSAPLDLVKKRLRQGKIVFMYAERFYKENMNSFKYFKNRISAWLHHGRFQCKNLYMLSASAYTSLDAAMFNNYINRCYKWGYFPVVKKYEDITSLISKKEPFSLIWVARFLNLKHPEIPVLIAERLKREGYNFSLKMVGDGEKIEEIRNLIQEKGLTHQIQLLGNVKSDTVRQLMENSRIFLFTSDKGEGWGAVLNEAMNSGCACIASHAIGSVPYLIENNKNGIIYRDNNFEDIYEKVTFLLNNPSIAENIGKEAYRTLTDVWNADYATDRLLKTIEQLLQKGYCDLYQDGPCSKAEILKENWF